jgi:hypothetical protein
MNWWIAVPVGWMLVALVLGLFVARGIRIEAGDERECAVVPQRATEKAMPSSAAPPSASAADERRGAEAPAGSFAAAH